MNTQLSDIAITQLFKDVLIIPVQPKENTASIKTIAKDKEINHLKHKTASIEKKWWLGGNAKNIAIVIQDTQNVFIDELALQFLNNILAACKLNMEDIAIINYANTPIGYTEIKEQLSNKKIFLFGVNAQQMQLSFAFPLYQEMQYEDCVFVMASPLKSLMQTTEAAKAEKAKLWHCLKNMFKI